MAAASMAVLLAMAGCAQKPAATASTTRMYEIDQLGGAKTCTAPAVTPAAGKTVPATITVANDGGWCGVAVSDGGKAFSAGLLRTRAAHGEVYVHTVGDMTRIDYTPARGFTGTDSFTVALLPGEAVVQAAVSVMPGPASVAPAAAPAPAPKASTTHRAPAKKP